MALNYYGKGSTQYIFNIFSLPRLIGFHAEYIISILYSVLTSCSHYIFSSFSLPRLIGLRAGCHFSPSFQTAKIQRAATCTREAIDVCMYVCMYMYICMHAKLREYEEQLPVQETLLRNVYMNICVYIHECKTTSAW